MKNTHTKEFLVQAIDEDGVELFIASLEEGGYRFGWKGGPMMNVPKGHYVYQDIFYTEEIGKADAEWLEVKFEEWFRVISDTCAMLRKMRQR